MEPQPHSGNRIGWVAAAALGVALLVALAVVLDLGPFADDELTEADFLAQGDAICREAHAGYEDLQRRPPRTANEAAALTEELSGISRDELDAIRDLAAPASLAASLNRYLEAREKGIERLREGTAAAEDGDALAYAKAQAALASTQEKRLRLARGVGFRQCSRILFGRDRLAADSEPPASSDPSAPPTVANPPTGAP
jgi:hypothetical protein